MVTRSVATTKGTPYMATCKYSNQLYMPKGKYPTNPTKNQSGKQAIRETP